MTYDTKMKIAVVQPHVPESTNPEAYITEKMRFARSAEGAGAVV